MKWLATAFLCVLAISTAHAEEQNPQGVQQFPMFVNCVFGSPENMLLQQYGELPFIEGIGSIVIPGDRNLSGVMTMYMSPGGSSYTIMFQASPDAHCLIMSGGKIEPIILGDPT